jgi:hypothetical protein
MENLVQTQIMILLEMYDKRDICAQSRNVQNKQGADLKVWDYE